MTPLSNWRSVRAWESQVERELRQRHSLWMHGAGIGFVVLGVMWAAAHLQMLLGSESLALRYLVTLGIGYLAYLLVLRLWAGALLGRESAADFTGDVPVPDLPAGTVPRPPAWAPGGGGDFGGGGATADFADGGGAVAQGAGEIAGGALELAAGADEGAVVVVPVVAIFLIGTALLFGAGSLLLLYFGWEALLTVAIELSFTYVSARVAVRVAREGWLAAAVRLTWKPLMGAVVCAVLLGASIDHWIPSANSLPQALQAIRTSSR